jgi:hypothetical protein
MYPCVDESVTCALTHGVVSRVGMEMVMGSQERGVRGISEPVLIMHIIRPCDLHPQPSWTTYLTTSLGCTGAGGDNGIDHNKNWLRFPYDSTFLRSHYLHPHP